MTKKEEVNIVVKSVRNYIKGELKLQNFDLDGLNVALLNNLIKTTLNDILEESTYFLEKIENEE